MDFYAWFHSRKTEPKKTHQINLDNWLQYHELVLQDQDYRQPKKSLIKLVFDTIDLDESGNLDQNEWQNLFKVYNIPVIYTPESFAKIDLNHDGLLSQEEVLS